MSADRFEVQAPVCLIDEMTVLPGKQQAVFDLMTGEYARHVAQRQLKLVGSWLLPPFERPGESSNLLLVWEFPTSGALWAARMAEETDAVAARLWMQVDTMVGDRSRRLGRSAPMLNCGPDTGPIATPESPPGSFHRILFIAPTGELSVAQQQQWRDTARSVKQQLSAVLASDTGFHEGYSFLPGQMTWDVTLSAPVANESLLAALPGPAHVTDCIDLDRPIDAGVRAPGIARGIKRTVLMKLVDGVSAERRDHFERTLSAVPRYVTGLLNWRFSRVLRAGGATAWTHCIEHEVTDAAVFGGDYLNHPYHWAIVERLFHPEAPERVSVAFSHTLYPIDRSVISPASR
jgi:hypothetical protein